MFLSHFHIHDVRNILQANIEFGSHLNIFYGENGSGKSSILEAIYLLSTGKSFRSRHITKIINEKKTKLTLFGKLISDDKTTTLGIEKSSTKHLIQIDGKSVRQVSQLALCLPVLVITQDSHKLLESGPQWRRQFIDWGLFHVKHNFMSTWVNYRKSLKSRNQALMNKASRSEIDAWNDGLASYGELYSSLREDYIKSLIPIFTEYTSYLLGQKNCDIKYRQGWPKDTDLLSCLGKQYERDIYSFRTSYGPHRADITVMINGRDSKDHASRGQQKLLVYALYLAQITYLKREKSKDTLLLLDDIGSELDRRHVEKLIRLVSEEFSQVCITTANLESLPTNQFKDIKLFHVEHGNVTEK